MPTKKQITELSKMLREERKRLGSWPAVRETLYDGKIGITALSRIASPHDPHWPKEKAIRDLLIPPPGPNEIAKRTLVIHATIPETHFIQNWMRDPRGRTGKLLEGAIHSCGAEMHARCGRMFCPNCEEYL